MKQNLLLFAVFITLAIAYDCTVTDIQVRLVVPGTGFTLTQIQQRLNSSNITFANPNDHVLACIDGRSSEGIIGTPGGDSGEFLAALAVLSRNGYNLSTQQSVSSLLDGFISTEAMDRGLYMHSDEHTLDTLITALNGSIPNFDITNVSPQYQEQVLQYVVNPTYIGCGHIKGVRSLPDSYQLNANITEFYIRAFHDFLWNREDFPQLVLHFPNFTILHDNHTEGAVLNVISDISQAGNCSWIAPMVTPRIGNESLFVNHPQFVNNIRTELSDYMAPLVGLSSAAFRQQLDVMCELHLNLTISRLAPTLPVYQATLKVVQKSSNTTSNSTSTSTTTADSSSTTGEWQPPSSNRAYLGPLFIILLLIFFLAGTYGLWKWNKQKRIAEQARSAPPSTDKDFVPLDEVQSKN